MSTDHKAEALRLAADSSPSHSQSMDGLAVQMEAQVHAALYAAEQTAELVAQQKLANLIDRWNGLTNLNPGERLDQVAQVEVDWLDVLIREGLGLA